MSYLNPRNAQVIDNSVLEPPKALRNTGIAFLAAWLPALLLFTQQKHFGPFEILSSFLLIPILLGPATGALLVLIYMALRAKSKSVERLLFIVLTLLVPPVIFVCSFPISAEIFVSIFY